MIFITNKGERVAISDNHPMAQKILDGYEPYVNDDGNIATRGTKELQTKSEILTRVSQQKPLNDREIRLIIKFLLK